MTLDASLASTLVDCTSGSGSGRQYTFTNGFVNDIVFDSGVASGKGTTKCNGYISGNTVQYTNNAAWGRGGRVVVHLVTLHALTHIHTTQTASCRAERHHQVASG